MNRLTPIGERLEPFYNLLSFCVTPSTRAAVHNTFRGDRCERPRPPPQSGRVCRLPLGYPAQLLSTRAMDRQSKYVFRAPGKPNCCFSGSNSSNWTINVVGRSE